jgi:hypothetical protein
LGDKEIFMNNILFDVHTNNNLKKEVKKTGKQALLIINDLSMILQS